MRIVALTFASRALRTACRQSKDDGSGPTTASLAEDGSDANEIESHASALTASTTLATMAFDEPLRAATVSAASTKNFFFPAGCATSEVDRADPSTVIHTFDGCTGPWGLVRVSGKITVTYSATTLDGAPALMLEVTGDDVRIRKSTADFHAKAVLGGSGANRTMTYSAELSGTTARGHTTARTVDWTAKWRVGEQCLTLDGTTKGSIADRSIRTTIRDFQRCKSECPAAGGRITIENENTRASVALEFDGSATAKVRSSDGTTASIALACGL
jgi:hypothetical protein